uniref:Solute carrier family 38 member 5 n=1 Tax=Xenopus tropicalis TaxID=8364 RepID=A0A6I8SJW4_XENTR
MELDNLGDGEDAHMLNGSVSESLNTERLNMEDGDEAEEAALEEREKFLSHVVPQKSNFTDFEGKTSFGMSVFNLSNAIMGSGILGLAYAMSNTGIILFVFLLISIALLSCYSIHLLLKCSGVVAMSSYLYIIKYELPLVIQTFMGLTSNSGAWYMNGNYLIVIVSILVILPLALMKHLGYLGYTSGFSLTCMVFFLCSVIYKYSVIPCPLNSTVAENHTIYTNGQKLEEEDVCTAKLLTVNSQTAYSIPIVAFAFVCHPEVLPIYTELRRASKSRMQNVANVSIFAMFIMYLLTAIFGYLTFYGNVESEMLHTYNKVDPLDKLMLCVRLAVLVAVTLTVPVVLFPIRRAIQQLLCPGQEFKWWRHILIAVVLLIAVNILVIFVPNIRDIFGVIGNICILRSLQWETHTQWHKYTIIYIELPDYLCSRLLQEPHQPRALFSSCRAFSTSASSPMRRSHSGPVPRYRSLLHTRSRSLFILFFALPAFPLNSLCLLHAGCLVCFSGIHFHDNEPEFHHSRLGDDRKEQRWGALTGPSLLSLWI